MLKNLEILGNQENLKSFIELLYSAQSLPKLKFCQFSYRN